LFDKDMVTFLIYQIFFQLFFKISMSILIAYNTTASSKFHLSFNKEEELSY